tara:strand:- start:50 stop:763 length:714 start_codon:yes stop_codon:yes gene_type:complete
MKKLLILLFIFSFSCKQTAEEYINSAEIKLDSKDFKGAAEELDKAVDAYPKNSDLWLMLAVANEKQYSYTNAKYYYSKAVELGTMRKTAYYNAANLYLKDPNSGEAVFAIQFLDRLIEIYSTDADAYFLRGSAYSIEGDNIPSLAADNYKKSIIDYEKVIELTLEKTLKDGKFVLLKPDDMGLLADAYYNKAVTTVNYAGETSFNDSIYYSYCKDLKNAEKWGHKSALKLAKQLNCR